MNKERLKERHAKYIEQLKALEGQKSQLKQQYRGLNQTIGFVQGAILELQNLIDECPDMPTPPSVPVAPPTKEPVSSIE